MNPVLESLRDPVAVFTAPAQTNPSLRILVVEGDPNIRQFSVRVLIRSGYRVDAAADGQAGWEAVCANNYNLLITDIDMPKLSGLELVKKLHSVRLAPPVILASGASAGWDQSLHLAATLPKPFSADQLLETVRAVLRAPDRDYDRPEPYRDWGINE